MRTTKFVMLMSWTSFFALLWLMILRVIPRTDLFSWGMFLIFLILCLLAGGAANEASKK